jgi:hypothetical protein
LAFGFESYRTMEANTKPMPRAILSDGIERVRTAASTVVATMDEGFAYAYRILSAYLNVAGIKIPFIALSMTTPQTGREKPANAARSV